MRKETGIEAADVAKVDILKTYSRLQMEGRGPEQQGGNTALPINRKLD